MRVHFQATPWDLYVCAGYALGASFVFVVSGTGNLLAIPLIVFVPGYVLVAALFPKDNEIQWLERTALSVGLSIVINPLLGFLLDFSTLRIGFASVVAATLFFVLTASLFAYWRRMSLAPELRLSLGVVLGIPEWSEDTLTEKIATVALVVGVIVAGLAFVYVSVTPRPPDRFTEFYMFYAGPSQLNRSEPRSVSLGISNREGVSIEYTIRVNLVGVRVVYNTTSGFNETERVNVTSLAWLNASLVDGSSWAHDYTFSVAQAGTWEVEFLLFRDRNFSLAYRQLHLSVRVL